MSGANLPIRGLVGTAIAICMWFTLAPSIAAHSQEDQLIDMNKQCGPLSGKLPSQMTQDEYNRCADYAARANKALGLPGPGFKTVTRQNTVAGIAIGSLPCQMQGYPAGMPAGMHGCFPGARFVQLCTGHGGWVSLPQRCQ
jgi:hypothetical protein